MAAIKLGKMIIRSLFNKPATLMYPVVQRQWQERTRGHIESNIDSCIFCGICQRKCPSAAITVDRPNRTWSIARMQCIQCGCCVEACPKKCLRIDNAYTSPGTVKIVDTYAAMAPEPKPETQAEPAEVTN